MSEPRNVTPDEVKVSPPHTTDEEFRARYYEERREEPEWMAWKWASRGRSFPWLGVLLVLIGVGLLVQFFVPDVRIGTLVLAAIGGAFLAGWIFGGSRVSMVPGVLLVALSAGLLAEDLGLILAPRAAVPGLISFSLAVGFLAIWLLAYRAERRWSWPLWGAAIFGLIAFVQASGQLVGIPELGAIWPVLLIALGVLLLLNARRR
jgi:hypothetical protein